MIEYLRLPPDINVRLGRDWGYASLMLMGPPRHGKTDLACHIAIWLIIKWRRIRILLCMAVGDTVEDSIRMIRRQLTDNEYIARWGPFRSSPWSSTVLRVVGAAMDAKTNTLRGVSIDTDITSKDADLIVFDDPQGVRTDTTQEVVDAQYSWLRAALMSRREPGTSVIGLGSHMPIKIGDIWNRIEHDLDELNTPGHTVLLKKVKAHNDEACNALDDDCEKLGCDPVHHEDLAWKHHVDCLLWPSLRPKWWLDNQRGTVGELIYMAQYQQVNKDPKLADFPPDILNARFTPAPPLAAGEDRSLAYAGTEPGVRDVTRSWGQEPPRCCAPDHYWALGLDPSAEAYNGLVVRTACPACGRTYYVDVYAEVMPVASVVPWMFGVLEQYPKCRHVRIESNAMQKYFADEPRTKDRAAQLGVLVETWNTDARRNAPEFGVPSLAIAIRNGHASVPYRLPADERVAKKLINQMKLWPTEPNDIVLADWFADLTLRTLCERWRASQGGSNMIPGWAQPAPFMWKMYGREPPPMPPNGRPRFR